MSFDLLSSSHYPAELAFNGTLSRAVDHLRATFVEILGGRGFSASDLTSARLAVAFPADFPDLDLFATHARLEAGERCYEKVFSLPAHEVLTVLNRERNMTLMDRITTRAQLDSDSARADTFK